MLKRLSDAASELFSSAENLAKRHLTSENRPPANNNSFFLKSREYHWDDEEDSIMLSSDLDDYANLPLDSSYMEVLHQLESDPKMRQFLFWTSKDLDSIPLRLDEIRAKNEIYSWMKMRECIPFTRRIFCRHPDLTVFMRSKLISWLFEVALHFRLERATLYLTFNYMDTFLANEVNLMRDKYQLLALAALLLASKVEEMRPPPLRALSEICEHAFSCREIADFELKLSRTLDWHFLKDTLVSWLQFYAESLTMFLAQSDVDRLLSASFRLADMCLHSPVSLNFTASSLAAAILLFHFNSTTHSIDSFILSTSFKPVQLESELLWLKVFSSPFKVAYVDPKYHVTEDQFNHLLDENIKALAFLNKVIKIENAKYRQRDESIF